MLRLSIVRSVLVLFLALSLAGCINADTGEDENQPIEPTYRDVFHNETVPLEIPVETGVHPQETDLPGEASLTIPDRSTDLTFTPSWTVDTNSFRLVFDRPDGKTDTVDIGSNANPIVYADPAIGTYTLHLKSQGIVQEDTVTIQATYQWIERVYDDATPGAAELGGVSIARDGDHWKATLTTQTRGDADTFELATSSGDITVGPAADATSTSTITVTARAADKEAARSAVRQAVIENSVRDGTLTAKATWQPNTGNDGIQRSILVAVTMPDGLSGRIDTSSGEAKVGGVAIDTLAIGSSSGDIRFEEGTEVGSLELDTSSGDATGTLNLAGDATMQTSSGDLQLTLLPTVSLRLSADTSSGDLILKLREGKDIAYDLELRTSSGEFSESMDGAGLEYPDPEDDEHAFLRTTDGAGRTIQVSGDITTSSGDQSYGSA